MDLVEISANAEPPVCRIIDYQKFLYEQKKKLKDQKKNCAKISVKEIRLSVHIDTHDFNFKVNNATKFLKAGNKVKVDILFKGREITYSDQGTLTLLKFADAVLDYGKPEALPKLEGKRMIMIIAPKK